MSESNPVIELDAFAGSHILKVCERAVDIANDKQQSVRFIFNGTPVIVQPGESARAAHDRWAADFEAAAEAWRNSDEYKDRERRRADEEKRAREAVLAESAKTEQQMREAEGPSPHTPKQLGEYIESLVRRDHDYGTCVYAMSLAAVAAFNYVAKELGCTGFQASCADLDILRRTRHLNGPFLIIKAEDALYPQYDLRDKLEKFLAECGPWLKEQATSKLATETVAHEDILAYWKRLAEGRS